MSARRKERNTGGAFLTLALLAARGETIDRALDLSALCMSSSKSGGVLDDRFLFFTIPDVFFRGDSANHFHGVRYDFYACPGVIWLVLPFTWIQGVVRGTTSMKPFTPNILCPSSFRGQSNN